MPRARMSDIQMVEYCSRLPIIRDLQFIVQSYLSTPESYWYDQMMVELMNPVHSFEFSNRGLHICSDCSDPLFYIITNGIKVNFGTGWHWKSVDLDFPSRTYRHPDPSPFLPLEELLCDKCYGRWMDAMDSADIYGYDKDK